MDFLWHFVEG